jgi:hypothetical protein
VGSEFNWWLLLVGIVVGAALAWLVLADFGSDEAVPGEGETDLQLEADWIAARFEEHDRTIDPDEVVSVLELDRLYQRPDGPLAPTRRRLPRPTAPTEQPVAEDVVAQEPRSTSEARPSSLDRPA